VAPCQSMWPLLCNEIGLSYEQEEKVRAYQKKLLQTQESWLHRHSAFAAEKTMQSLHDAVQAITVRLGQRERSTQSILSEQQRMKLAVWATRNREQLSNETAKAPRAPTYHKFATSKSQHEAANLYTINHHLQMVLQKVPPAAPLVSGIHLQKLARRPLFESLSCGVHSESGEMFRDESSGSLKRHNSEMSMHEGEGEDEGDLEERVHIPSVNPEEAQESAALLVEKVLGPLKEIMPEPPAPFAYVSVGPTNLALPAPTPVSSMTQLFYPAMDLEGAPSSAPSQFTQPRMVPSQAGLPQAFPYAEATGTIHARKSSFIPPHLNVVPEEMWPGDSADDFLMNLVEGDWAIGEGVDMDGSSQ
jgi:hypothetical protein